MMVLLDRSFDTVSANAVVLCANVPVFYGIFILLCTDSSMLYTHSCMRSIVVHALMIYSTFLLLEQKRRIVVKCCGCARYDVECYSYQ